MRNILMSLKTPAVISLVLVLPFICLELINRQPFEEDFPVMLFSMLWILPLIFFLILSPVVQNVRSLNKRISAPGLVVRVVASILLIGFWLMIIVDQMPCFLGMGNCD